MAISFAGGTDRINYGGSGVPSQIGCMAFRMRTTQTTTNAVCAALWTSTSRNGFGFILNNTANKLLVNCVPGSSTVSAALVSTTTVNDGNWHKIALNWNTANGGANALFVDGVQEATANSSAVWTLSGSDSLVLGDMIDAFWPSYVGELAELAEWTRQLDAAEIAALGKDISPSKVASNALKVHAPLVRSPNNKRFGSLGYDTSPTVVGTAVSVHPRIIGAVV